MRQLFYYKLRQVFYYKMRQLLQIATVQIQRNLVYVYVKQFEIATFGSIFIEIQTVSRASSM